MIARCMRAEILNLHRRVNLKQSCVRVSVVPVLRSNDYERTDEPTDSAFRTSSVEPSPSPRPLRLRFPFVALLLFWIATIVGSRIDKPYFIGFMFALATTALVSLCFLGWWWLNRGLRLWEKALGFLVLVAGAFVVSKNSHHTINAFVLWMAGLPNHRLRDRPLAVPRPELPRCVPSDWLCCPRHRRIVCAFLLVRADSATGDLHVKYHWRWTPTAEQRFLTSAQPAPARATAAPAKLEVSSGDWTEFRGRNRDGIIHNANLTTNWSGTPPTLVWKHRWVPPGLP